MRKLILTSAVLLSTALGATTFALADTAPKGDHAARFASMCTDRSARETGHLAYLEAKLKPTSAQASAWNAYKDVLTSQAKTSEAACLDRAASMKGDFKRPTIIERQAMMEKGLETKLANMKASEPALTGLYASLTDEQKQVLDKEGGRHGGNWHRANWHGDKHHGGMEHKAGFKHHADQPAADDQPASTDTPIEQ